MTLYINLVNQVFEIEQKLRSRGDSAEIGRHIDRIKNILEEAGYSYHSPLNEKYTDTRTDCEASLVGSLSESMVISKVIKPIVFHKEGPGSPSIVQKAVVLVESRK